MKFGKIARCCMLPDCSKHYLLGLCGTYLWTEVAKLLTTFWLIIYRTNYWYIKMRVCNAHKECTAILILRVMLLICHHILYMVIGHTMCKLTQQFAVNVNPHGVTT